MGSPEADAEMEFCIQKTYRRSKSVDTRGWDSEWWEGEDEVWCGPGIALVKLTRNCGVCTESM